MTPPRNLRVLRIVYFCDRSSIFEEYTECAQYVLRLYCDRCVTFLSVLRYCFAVFCDVISQNAFCDYFAVFCGVLQMFCERCFVQYSRFVLLSNSKHARNTRVYCEFFLIFSVF